MGGRWSPRFDLPTWTGQQSGTQSFTNVSITGTLSVGGATTLSSTLAVTGALTQTGAATLGSTLAVTGATTLSSTLAVTGATTLSSTLAVTGNSTLTGDLAVNGGDFTSSATTFNLLAATVTTLNFGRAAAINMGAAGLTTTIYGSCTINQSASIVGVLTCGNTVAANGSSGITTTQTTFPLVNDTATTVNFAGAATALTMGATASTTTTIRGGTLVGNTTTQNVFNTTATTVNAFGAATSILIGAASGSAAFLNPTFNVGDATTLSQHRAINIRSNSNGYYAQLIFQEANTNKWRIYHSMGTDTLIVYSDTNGSIHTNYTITGLTTALTTFNLYNTVATTMNFAGAATTLNMGAGASSSATLSFTTGIALNTSAITSNQSTVALINTTATTVNCFGAATAISHGASTGTTTFNHDITMADAKNLIVNTTTGTKIGTATGQKIGFHNATPSIQYATTGTSTGFTAGAGTAVTHLSTFTGNSGSTAYTIADIVLCLKTKGLMAA